MEIIRLTKTLTHVLLTIVIILFIVTGFGISNYQIVESITLGLLYKPTSYQLHSNLIVPLLVLLTLHIAFVIIKKRQKKQFKPPTP